MEWLKILVDYGVVGLLICLSFASTAIAVERWLVMLIYSITENIDVDAGYERGLTKPEVNNTGLAGLIFRF